MYPEIWRKIRNIMEHPHIFPSFFIIFFDFPPFCCSNAKSTWPAALSGSAAPASSTPWSRKNHWMWMDWDTTILDFWPTQWDRYETYMAYIWGIYIYISIIYPGYHIWLGNYMNTGHQWMDWIEDLQETKVLLSNMEVFCEISLQPFLGRQGGGLIFYEQSWRSHDVFHHANMLVWISLIFHPSTEIKGTVWTILIRCQP